MKTAVKDFGWGPLFDGLEAVSEPQTGGLPPIKVDAAVPHSEDLQTPSEAKEVKVPTIAPHRKAEVLAETSWRIAGVCPGGILLRDGADGHWYEETLWVMGINLGRSYGIVFEGQEYEFHSRLCLRNEKRKVFLDPEVEPPAEAA
jgi:hypothetical protein